MAKGDRATHFLHVHCITVDKACCKCLIYGTFSDIVVQILSVNQSINKLITRHNLSLRRGVSVVTRVDELLTKVGRLFQIVGADTRKA